MVHTTEVTRVVERAHRSQLLLNGGQLFVNPIIKVNTFLGNWKCLGSIFFVLEGSLMPEVEEVPIVQGTQEADLSVVELVVLACAIGCFCQISIEEHDVETQTLVAPLGAKR